MSAKVSFLTQEVTPDQQKPLLAVNPDALVQRDGRTVVFVVRDGRAVAVPVGDPYSFTVSDGDGTVTRSAGGILPGPSGSVSPRAAARRR